DGAGVDLGGAVAGLAAAGRAGQHAVLGGEPALAAADQERRHGRLDGAGAEHGGAAHFDQDTAGSGPGVAAGEGQGAGLVGPAVGAGHGGQLARAVRWFVTNSTISAALVPNIWAIRSPA